MLAAHAVFPFKFVMLYPIKILLVLTFIEFDIGFKNVCIQLNYFINILLSNSYKVLVSLKYDQSLTLYFKAIYSST